MRRLLVMLCAVMLAVPAGVGAAYARADNSSGGGPPNVGGTPGYGGVGGQSGADTGAGAGAGNGTNAGNAGATGGGAPPAGREPSTGAGVGGETTTERGRNRGERSPWGWLLVLVILAAVGAVVAKIAFRRGDVRESAMSQ